MGFGLAGQVCTLVLGGRRCGIDIAHVREVVRPDRVTPVPLAPSAVAGMFALRGRVLPVLDLGPRFGGAAGGGLGVVVDTGRAAVLLRVETVGDVVALPPGAPGPAPADLPDEARPLVAGTCTLPDGELLLLDPDRALS